MRVLDCWVAFTLITFEDLTTIRDNAPFTINAVKLRRLAILKFWIEDKIRMYEPPVATQFTQDTIITYNRLYETFVASRDCGAPILGPIFDEDDWEGFETVTTSCLNSVQGRGGVPLSYILRDNSLRPTITNTPS